jgi:hypothetical protein
MVSAGDKGCRGRRIGSRLRIREYFLHLIPLEFLRSCTRLVRPQPFNGLDLFVLVEEASGGDIVVQDEVDERRCKACHDTNDNEDQLPRCYLLRYNVTPDSVRSRSKGCKPTHSPKERIAANMVASPLVEYQAATRRGCSERRYHWAVMTLNNGKHPASNRPSKNRVATRPEKLCLYVSSIKLGSTSTRTCEKLPYKLELLPNRKQG